MNKMDSSPRMVLLERMREKEYSFNTHYAIMQAIIKSNPSDDVVLDIVEMVNSSFTEEYVLTKIYQLLKLT